MRTSFYSTDQRSIDIGHMVLIGIAIFATVWLAWYYLGRVDHVRNMIVQTKTWSREVREQYDYTTTDIETECDIHGENCHPVPVTHHHTQLVKRCPSSGDYNVEPYFAECSIGWGHYATYGESYKVVLNDDGKMYGWNVSFAMYHATHLKDRCQVGLSYFDYVLRSQCE